jgi:hypothetical protein
MSASIPAMRARLSSASGERGRTASKPSNAVRIDTSAPTLSPLNAWVRASIV